MKPAAGDTIARRLYAALDGRDATAVAAVLDDASVLHLAGASGLAGDYQGGEAIIGLLRRMAELTGGSLRYGAARPVADARGRAVLMGRTSAIRRDRRLDTDVTIAVTVGGGVVREAWVFCLDQAACDGFWA